MTSVDAPIASTHQPTPKPQTTRNRITGVYNHERGQIVFVDTPGVHGSSKALNRFMVQQALGGKPLPFVAEPVIDAVHLPAGLASAQVPQFILLGFDDNPDAEPVNWVVDHLDAQRNPAGAGQAATFDGAPVRMIFFSNGRHWKDRATVAAHQRAFAAGHEIANHTQNHDHGREFTLEQWKKDNPKEYAQRTAIIPLQRFGDPEDDIGRALVALASADAHYITSATVTVDGGAYFL